MCAYIQRYKLPSSGEKKCNIRTNTETTDAEQYNRWHYISAACQIHAEDYPSVSSSFVLIHP